MGEGVNGGGVMNTYFCGLEGSLTFQTHISPLLVKPAFSITFYKKRNTKNNVDNTCFGVKQYE